MANMNRLKGVVRTKANMVKWDFNGEDDTCEVATVENRPIQHLLSCTMNQHIPPKKI